MTPEMHRVAPSRSIPMLAVLALLLVATLIAIALVGARLRIPRELPPPFGLAATGLFAFDTNGQVVLAEHDGSGIRQLHPSGPGGSAVRATHDGSRQFGATFSRDGTHVAFWQEDGWKVIGGNAEKAADLWVVDVDGSHAMNLTAGLELAPMPFAPAGTWSPDGSSIAFTADVDVRMYVVAADGSAPPRAIGDDTLAPTYPAWAPDGSLIAFTGIERKADGELAFPPVPKVYVIRPDGTGQEQVSRSSGGTETGILPQWSPDGRMLLYDVDVSDPDVPPIVDAQGNAVLPEAPAPRELVLAEHGSSGWTERVVVERSARWMATFSNDGSRIAFLRSRPDMFDGDLFVIGVDGKGERRVSDRLVNLSSPCWSPDDRTITMLTGPVPADWEQAFGWPNRVYVQFPVEGAGLVEIPAGTVAGVLACSWQRLAP